MDISYDKLCQYVGDLYFKCKFLESQNIEIPKLIDENIKLKEQIVLIQSQLKDKQNEIPRQGKDHS